MCYRRHLNFVRRRKSYADAAHVCTGGVGVTSTPPVSLRAASILRKRRPTLTEAALRYVNAALERLGGVYVTQRRPECARAALRYATPLGWCTVDVALTFTPPEANRAALWLRRRRPKHIGRRCGYVDAASSCLGGVSATISPPERPKTPPPCSF